MPGEMDGPDCGMLRIGQTVLFLDVQLSRIRVAPTFGPF
jgi:hypothetical protein